MRGAGLRAVFSVFCGRAWRGGTEWNSACWPPHDGVHNTAFAYDLACVGGRSVFLSRGCLLAVWLRGPGRLRPAAARYPAPVIGTIAVVCT